MKKKRSNNIKTLLITISLLLVAQMIDRLPWWSFVIPVLAFGVLISVKKWEISAFGIGFVAGFLVWLGANLYFDMTLGGIALDKIGLMLSVPKLIVMLISALIGGLLTALALYTGKFILAVNRELHR